ncbi:MAG TPA: hypothetical protein VHW46_10135 [Terracidiphilus sp.]|nr:hypothetical protein [Terracidiphilus sp.]
MTNAAVLRDRVTQMVWAGNAMVGCSLALLGGLLACRTFGNLDLALFGAPVSVIAIGSGVGLVACAVWRMRQAGA